MGLDRPGITPTRKKVKRKKPAPPPRGVFGPEGRTAKASTPAALRKPPVIRRKGPKPKVDTGNIMKGAREPSAAETRRANAAIARERNRPKPKRKQSFLENLEDELTGRGVIAKTVARIAHKVTEDGVVPNTANVGGPAGIANRRGRRGSRIAAATAPTVKLPPVARRFAEDAVNLPAAAIPSLYVPAAAAVEAAGGDTRRAKQLGKDIKATDPVYNLVTGHPKKALKLANEHPGFAAAEVFGAKGAVGRGAGRAVRGTGNVIKATGRATKSKGTVSTGERVRRVAAVETRPDSRVPGTATTQRREYSRDLINKGVQVKKDRVQANRAAKKRTQAAAVQESDPKYAVKLRKRANELDPLVMSDRDVKARVNLNEARDESLRASKVGDVDKRVQSIIKDAGDKGAAPVLVASGITRAHVRDLTKYRNELAAAHANIKDPARKAANVRLRNAIDVSIEKAGKRNDPELRQVLAAAKRYSAEIDKPLAKILDDVGLLPRERGDKARLIPYAAREMGATHDGSVIVDRAGAPLQTGTIKARYRNDREVDPSYTSQAPNANGPGAHYVASVREPTIGSKARTGKATTEGTFDATPESLRSSAKKQQGLATAAQNFRKGIAEMGLRDEAGEVRTNLTRSQADDLARNLELTRGEEWAPVAVRPWAASKEHLQAMQDAIDSGGHVDPHELTAFHKSLQEAFEGKGDGPFTLIPRAAAKQRAQHLKVLDPTDFGKGARALRSSFTRTVLTTSPGPTFGNIVEPGFRAAAMRAGPVSAVRGIRTMHALKKMDPEAHANLVATLGRGKVTLASSKRYVDPQQFDKGFTRKAVALFQASKQLKYGPKQAVAAWDAWTHLVFSTVNGKAEAFFRQGPMLGKVLKDSGLMDKTLMDLSSKSMHEAARGIRDTPTQALLARKLNDAYGKYQGFSPSGRRIIAEYTPFAAWFLSAGTFVGKVLPRDHPALLAFTASMESATEEWRKAQGLDLFMGEGKLPGWLQGTVPAGKAGRAKAAYNTPFGAFTDPTEAAASLVFPQGENLLKAFQGLDWKNAKLRNDDGSEYDEIQKALHGMFEVVKSTTPAVAVPVKAIRYAKKPRSLLNPVLVPPKQEKSTGGSSAADEIDFDDLDFGDDTDEIDFDDLDFGP